MENLSESLFDLAIELILRKVLTPTYPAGCKRILFADGYFEAMTSNKFRLECSPILTFTQDWLQDTKPRIITSNL